MELLFKSKKESLKDWLRGKLYVRTSDIIRWGSEHYCNGSDRIARQLAEEGFMKRLSKQEKKNACFNTAEGVYRLN